MQKEPSTCFICYKKQNKIFPDTENISCIDPKLNWTINKELAKTQAVCDDKTNAELPTFE
jgi:hypothetical protein